VTVLGRVNHARLVRLCGLCVHRGDTHLVFEFIENGALSNQLTHGGGQDAERVLGWRQRVLNHLHNYARPPYVHKNLSLSALFGSMLHTSGDRVKRTSNRCQNGTWQDELSTVK
jgi:hypothetical protein